MVNSVVLICPQQHRAALNALGEALGEGPDNWSVPLSASGQFPATHWGAAAWEQPGQPLNTMRLAIQSGQTPAGYESYDEAFKALTIRVGQPPGVWNSTLAELGLTRIME